VKLSNYLFFTTKETPAEAELISHQLMLRAGLIKPAASGLYSFLPVGYRVLDKIASLVKEEMDNAGAQQLLLPFIQPAELWKRSGRWDEYGKELLRFKDRKGSWFILSPTHEEIITDLVAEVLTSYKKLPVVAYQIQIKFRDELRSRGGVIRSREFLMKDAYSFCQGEDQMKEIYQGMKQAYEKIFSRCGLEYKLVEAESGPIGGDISHEFIALAPLGEDKIVECQSCEYAFKLEKAVRQENEESSSENRCPVCQASLQVKRGLEVGHLFQLGYKYSSSLGAFFLDQTGKKLPLLMGCYGIGISRLPAAIIEQNYDEEGIIWPEKVAPFAVVVIPTSERTFNFSEKLYRKLKDASIDVLWDDRDISAGAKFKDSDLIGIPLKIIVGKTFLKEGNVEIKKRKSGELIKVKKEELIKKVEELV